ncbi:MAG: hypothetical protein HZRFUVUK_000775 [Candidatus Fervidibacterota bacterium]
MKEEIALRFFSESHALFNGSQREDYHIILSVAKMGMMG